MPYRAAVGNIIRYRQIGGVINEKNCLSLPKKKMIHQEARHCLYCTSNDLVKNGKSANGIQRWRCNSCKKGFRFDYRYNACKAGISEKIIELTMNGSGVRDIGRVLRISKDTVCSVLKKNFAHEPLLFDKAGKGKDAVVGG
jgi:transposase-like protein